ncbi:Flp family type IVb pilin [Sneathiella sp.]|uniref:Flp family type IVb pilin n=1 Tax=Sneathiella sp. TaxID=1964365 RepID=UPI0026119963|nr:Flp family type IVb pilin [Sneathiella sp.]MDF2368853.1 Flp family type IVb pilin [Sneathiella sp.]
MYELKKLYRDDAGATAIEYGLIASLVAIAGIIAFTAMGDSILTSFTGITEGFCVAIGGDFSLTDDGIDSCTLS